MNKHIIIEGIDRVGKSTLIDKINANDEYNVLASGKPLALEIYNYSLELYQRDYFDRWSDCLKYCYNNTSLLFDRFHLGEYVYSPLYRNYSGDYVYDLEDRFKDNTTLVLLVMYDLSLRKDDGECFDFDNGKKEQEKFIEAFNKSNVKRKKIIQVDIDGHMKTPDEIYQEFLSIE